MNLGNVIRTLRIEKGLTKAELAANCGITKAVIYWLESNSPYGTNTSTTILKEIAHQLGVPFPILIFLALDAEDILPLTPATMDLVDATINLIKTKVDNRNFIPYQPQTSSRPKGRNGDNPKPVYLFDTALEKKLEFQSAKEAADFLKVSQACIRSDIQRKSKVKRVFFVSYTPSV